VLLERRGWQYEQLYLGFEGFETLKCFKLDECGWSIVDSNAELTLEGFVVLI
jgi:hypothetical protein